MIWLFQLIKSHRLLTIAFGSACLGIFAGVLVWSGNARQPQSMSPTVTSKTAAISIVESQSTTFGNNSVLAVKLLNVSNKDIDAYAIGSGKTWVTRNYYLTEEPFAAGATITHLIPISSDDSQGLRSSFFKKNQELAVLAVLFTDGSTDGDPQLAKMLSDEHDGAREQAARILPDLQALTRLQSSTEKSVSDLENKVSRLPDKANTPVSSDYESGLMNAKRVLLTKIEVKERGNAQRTAEAGEAAAKVKKIFERLAQSPEH